MRVWVGEGQLREVWGAQQGEGMHLDVLWNCLVDESLVASGFDTLGLGVLCCHVLGSFSTIRVVLGQPLGPAHSCPSQRTGFPSTFHSKLGSLANPWVHSLVFPGSGASHS